MLRPRPSLPVLALLAVATTAHAQGDLYWVGNDPGPDAVRRAELDGSNIEVVVPDLAFPQDVAIDSTNGHVYWTDADTVMRADLDGANVITFTTTARATRGVAVDPAGDKVYWTETWVQEIQRANLDGTGVETIARGLDFPTDLAIDTADGRLYWTEQNARELWRADLDGANPELLHTDASYGLAIDPLQRTLYWSSNESVLRSGLDGSAPTFVRAVQGHIAGMALDPLLGKLYVVESGPSQIERMNLDGSDLELILPRLKTPLGIDLDLSACPPPAAALATEYGCGINPARSLLLDARPKLGRTLQLGVDNPLGTQAPGSIPFLVLAAAPDPAFPCGTPVRGLGMAGGGAAGELLVDPTAPLAVRLGDPWRGAGVPAVFALPLPAVCALLGAELWVQGGITDASPGATAPVGLAGAVQLRLGR